MSEEVADYLDDMADRIEKGGWQQGSFGGFEVDDQPVCLVGAAMWADAKRGFYRWNMESPGTVGSYAMHRISNLTNTDHLPVWNDKDGRTKQEVLDVLREGAKLERRAFDE